MKVRLLDVNRNSVGERDLPDGLPFRQSIEELVVQLGGKFVNPLVPLEKELWNFGVEVNGVSISPNRTPELTGDMDIVIVGFRHID